MAKKRIAINGFGRIGRLVFRVLYQDPEVEVVCINDLLSVTSPKATEEIAHLLKYDSTYRTFVDADKVKAGKNCIKIGDYKVAITGERDASKLPWAKMDIDVVIDCTGVYKTTEKAQAHLDAGAKKVVISCPGDEKMPTIVYGVNEKTLKKSHNIISGASCTTNCLAPMAKALNKFAPIEKGYMTTIHAYTGDQMPLDAFHKNGDLRRARAAAYNIVPNTTGAAKAIGLVIPELNGKLDGAAQRVPTCTGSLTELVAVCNKGKEEITAENVNKCMKKATNPSFAYTEDEIVSTDIIGMTAGSCFDATQTKIMDLGNNQSLVKVVAWYDNEYSYTNQLCRTVKYVCKKFFD